MPVWEKWAIHFLVEFSLETNMQGLVGDISLKHTLQRKLVIDKCSLSYIATPLANHHDVQIPSIIKTKALKYLLVLPFECPALKK